MDNNTKNDNSKYNQYTYKTNDDKTVMSVLGRKQIFNDKYGENGCILSEVVKLDVDKQYAHCKSTILIDGIVRSTAESICFANQVDNTNVAGHYLETAQTKSVGIALGNLGIGIDWEDLSIIPETPIVKPNNATTVPVANNIKPVVPQPTILKDDSNIEVKKNNELEPYELLSSMFFENGVDLQLLKNSMDSEDVRKLTEKDIASYKIPITGIYKDKTLGEIVKQAKEKAGNFYLIGYYTGLCEKSYKKDKNLNNIALRYMQKVLEHTQKR